MAARLKRDVQIRACRVLCAVFQRVALSVQTAAVFVPALANDASVLDDDAADHGVGTDMSCTALCQLECASHISFRLVLQPDHLAKTAC